MSGPPVPFPESLCHRCRHHRVVEGARTAYLMCRDPELPRYLPQPVSRCHRFDPAS